MDAYRDLWLSRNGTADGGEILGPVRLNTVDVRLAVRSLRHRTEVMSEKVWSFYPSDVGSGFANVVALVSCGHGFRGMAVPSYGKAYL
jgi:hypothetical protein